MRRDVRTVDEKAVVQEGKRGGKVSEVIDPDLILHLERKWFARIWNGEKTVEYREVKPYWDRRIGKWLGDNTPHFILFKIGYTSDGPRLLVQTCGIDVGPCPYPGWTGDYYRIRFEIVQPYMKMCGLYFPLETMPRMKESGVVKMREMEDVFARMRTDFVFIDDPQTTEESERDDFIGGRSHGKSANGEAPIALQAGGAKNPSVVGETAKTSNKPRRKPPRRNRQGCPARSSATLPTAKAEGASKPINERKENEREE